MHTEQLDARVPQSIWLSRVVCVKGGGGEYTVRLGKETNSKQDLEGYRTSRPPYASSANVDQESYM